MAFFKFRKAADEPASAPPQPQSIEAIRQRAKYRLVGASVLVLIGVIGFPLLFDKQPRPIAVDTPIDIPDRNKLAPLTLPKASAVAPTAPAASASVPLAAEPSVPVSDKSAPAATLASEPGVITETSDKNMPVAHVNKAQDATKNIVSDMPKPAKPAASAIVTKAAESASVQALLDAKNTEEPTAGANRFVVQVGAFADATRAREVRLKVEQAGLKTEPTWLKPRTASALGFGWGRLRPRPRLKKPPRRLRSSICQPRC
jgi:DedD protein